MEPTTPFADKARRGQEQYTADRDALEKDADLSVEAKQRKLAELREAHRTAQTDLRTQEKDYLEKRRSELTGSLFGVNRSDPAAVIGHRDASDRADKIRTQDEATALIARATANGDEQLAAAVAQRAADMDWAGAFLSWSDTRPHTHAPVRELSDIDTLLQPRTQALRSLMNFGGGAR